MDRWIIKRADGKYLRHGSGGMDENVYWVDKPRVFGGERSVVEDYYRHDLVGAELLEVLATEHDGQIVVVECPDCEGSEGSCDEDDNWHACIRCGGEGHWYEP